MGYLRLANFRIPGALHTVAFAPVSTRDRIRCHEPIAGTVSAYVSSVCHPHLSDRKAEGGPVAAA